MVVRILVLILTPQRSSDSDGPCPVTLQRKPVHVSNSRGGFPTQPSGESPKAQRETREFRDRTSAQGEAAESWLKCHVHAGGAGWCKKSVLKAGHVSMEGLFSHPRAATLQPAGNTDISFTRDRNKPCRAGDDKLLR